MTITLNNLGSQLLAQLYQTVTGGDGKVQAATDQFVTWVCPGLPFEVGDFAFAAKGVFNAASAEEQRTLANHAFGFSQLADFVPAVQGVYRTDGKRISEMYREVLRASKVAKNELTADQKAKLEKFRNLLWVTKKVKNLVTDEETEVTAESPLMTVYNEKMAAYIDAKLLYNSKRVAANTLKGPEGTAAVQDFMLNGDLYWQKVKTAEAAWVAAGYRNDVDAMNAYIAQTTERSMKLWKAGLVDRFNKASLSDLVTGNQFQYTTLYPGNFATSAGWQGMTTVHDEFHSSESQSYNEWSVSGGVNFGLWGAEAGASGGASDASRDLTISNFKLSYEIAQVVILRPGFSPEFFSNRGWILEKGAAWQFDAYPSDGQKPPKGVLVGYPTTAIFARNIKITSSDFKTHYQAHTSHFSANASGGWGPFRVSGSYATGSSDRHFDSSFDGNTITVPGMQLIGFVNHMIPKSPDPLPDLKVPDDFE